MKLKSASSCRLKRHQFFFYYLQHEGSFLSITVEHTVTTLFYVPHESNSDHITNSLQLKEGLNSVLPGWRTVASLEGWWMLDSEWKLTVSCLVFRCHQYTAMGYPSPAALNLHCITSSRCPSTTVWTLHFHPHSNTLSTPSAVYLELSNHPGLQPEYVVFQRLEMHRIQPLLLTWRRVADSLVTSRKSWEYTVLP